MVTQRTGSNSSSDADKVIKDFYRVIEDFYKLSTVDQKRVSKKLKPNHYFTVERKDGYMGM